MVKALLCGLLYKMCVGSLNLTTPLGLSVLPVAAFALILGHSASGLFAPSFGHDWFLATRPYLERSMPSDPQPFPPSSDLGSPHSPFWEGTLIELTLGGTRGWDLSGGTTLSGSPAGFEPTHIL